jgi:hypothetical protein
VLARDPALVAQAEQIPFRWYESAPADGVPSLFGAVGAASRLDDHVVGDERVFRVDRSGTLASRRPDGTSLWEVDLGHAFASSPVLAGYLPREGPGDARSIVIGGLVVGGWSIELRGALDGAQRWGTVGAATGQDLQIGVEGDLLAIHLREEERDRVLVLQLRDGLPLANRPLHPDATRASRTPPTTATLATRQPPAGDRLRCVGREPSTCTLTHGGVALAWESHEYATCRTLAVVEEGDDVVIAELCGAASGVTVHGFARATGERRWSTHPYGIGAIGHSRWSNEVRLALEGPYVRVWGDESSLTYVSTLDRASGRELATITAR